MSDASAPLVAVIMGSKSDWETMRHADETLTQFGIPHESKVMSAHRTPALTTEYTAEAEARGIEVIIAAAGDAAHLAVAIVVNTRPDLKKKLHAFRAEQARKIEQETLP